MVQELLASRTIGPLDRTEGDHCVAGLALFFGSMDVFHLLFNQHRSVATVILIDEWTYIIFYGLILARNNTPSERFRKFAEIWRIFCDNIDADDSENLNLLGSFAEALPHFLNAGTLGLQVIPPQHRAALALCCWDKSFSHFDALKGSDLTTAQILTLGQPLDPFNFSEASTIVSRGVDMIIKIIRMDPSVRASWLSTIPEILDLDEQHEDEPWLTSPLANAAFDFGRREGPNEAVYDMEQAIENIFDWLQMLADLGVDLCHYGRRESQALLHEFLDEWPYDSAPAWRFVAFKYGAYVLDWKFYLMPKFIEYEMAGAFWRYIEDPQDVLIPGTFIEDDEYEVQVDGCLEWMEICRQEALNAKNLRRMEWQEARHDA